MRNLVYIPEDRARELVMAVVKENAEKALIANPEGFTKHNINTGLTGYKTALHPNVENYARLIGEQVIPEIVRTAGFVHDIGKAFEGDIFHEIPAIEGVLSGRWELVTGGEKSERELAGKIISLCIASDGVLHEQIGGQNFPHSPYPREVIEPFKERIIELKRRLSLSEQKLSIEELTLPIAIRGDGGRISVMRYCQFYADLTGMGSLQERLDDCAERYGKPGRFYDPINSNLSRAGGSARMLQAASVIEGLIK